MFAYLKYDIEQKYKEDTASKKKSVNLFIVGVIGGLVWLLMSMYNDNKQVYSGGLSDSSIIQMNGGNSSNHLNIPVSTKFNYDNNNNVNSDIISSFELVGKKPLRAPSNDVFVDIADF